MAVATMTPNVLDFMQLTGSEDGSGIRVDEIKVAPESPLCGKTLMESSIKSELGLTVVGLRKESGEMRLNPAANERVEANDILVVVSPGERLDTVRKMTAAP